MSRANNGVKAIVRDNMQIEAPGNGGGPGGTMREGSAANDISAPVTMRDCKAITGSKGSSGTEMNMGGVGDRKGNVMDKEIGFGTR